MALLRRLCFPFLLMAVSMGQLASNQDETPDAVSIIQMRSASAPPLPRATDLLSPADLAPISNPLPEIQSSAASAVGQLVDQVMASMMPLLQSRLGGVMANSSAPKGLISIDISPNIEINMTTDMAGSFHNNNGAWSVQGDVSRINAAHVNFSKSLHHNNGAISNGNVTRTNGLITETKAENSASASKAAVETASTLGSLVLKAASTYTTALPVAPAKDRGATPRKYDFAAAAHAEDGHVGSPVSPNSSLPVPEQGVTGTLLTIKVTPTIKVHVDTNMSGAFFDNNNAWSTIGNVHRVNGAAVNAHFSAGLHDNNNAISNGTKDKSVQRFNGMKS